MSRLSELEAKAEELSKEIEELLKEVAGKNKDLTATLDEIDFIERKREALEFEKERL